MSLAEPRMAASGLIHFQKRRCMSPGSHTCPESASLLPLSPTGLDLSPSRASKVQQARGEWQKCRSLNPGWPQVVSDRKSVV